MSKVYFILISTIIFCRLCLISTSNEVDDPEANNIKFIPPFRPVIGIISQTVRGTNSSEIQQSYTNFVETGGGRVAPIPVDISDEDLFFLTKTINGVLFPGGGTPLEQDSRYYQLHKYFLDYSVQQTKQGNHFPIWGTCLGFQAIAQWGSNNFTLIPQSKFRNFNSLLPLEWNDNYAILYTSHLLNLCKATMLNFREAHSDGKLVLPYKQTFLDTVQRATANNEESGNPHKYFKDLLKLDLSFKSDKATQNDESAGISSDYHFSHWDQLMCSHRLFRAMQWLPLAAYNHQNGVTVTDWELNSGLGDLFEPLAFSTTDDGIKFVTIIEAKEYPIYGVQFHPEKNLFAFSPSINAPHGFFSAEMTQYFANFFINEARKNHQRFPDRVTEFENLIFKYQIVNSPLSDKIYDFLPMYIFPLDPSMLYRKVSIEDFNLYESKNSESKTQQNTFATISPDNDHTPKGTFSFQGDKFHSAVY